MLILKNELISAGHAEAKIIPQKATCKVPKAHCETTNLIKCSYPIFD